MSNKPDAADADAVAQNLGNVVLTGLWYSPSPEEIDHVRTYLAEMEASISLLPELSPELDSLDVGYDPTWPEVAQ